MKKRLYIFISFILFIAITSFASEPEKIKILFGPYLQNVTSNQATIVWATTKPATAWVEIAPDDSLNFYATERPKYFDHEIGNIRIDSIHKVTINGLAPNTSYRYRIYSKEVKDHKAYYTEYGKTVANDIFTKKPYKLHTLDKNAKSLSFSVFNDIHENNVLLKALLIAVKSNNNDFYIFNGDMVTDMDYDKSLYDSLTQKSIDEFASETQFYMVRGNHETRGTCSNKYMNYISTPTNKPFYTFKQGPCFFIVLDSGEDKPDSDIEYYGLADYDNYRKSQIGWLKNVIKSDDFKSSTYRIVLIHIPPTKSTWHGSLDIDKKFIPILNDNKIDLMLCGHLHRYEYIQKGSNGLNFPVIMNSNDEALKIKIDEKQIHVNIINQSGKKVKSFDFMAQ